LKLLLDTHILLWVMQDADALSARARLIIEKADEVYVSSISLWEVAIKSAAGKLAVEPARLEAVARDAGFLPLAVSWVHALALHGLPPLHRDPFDRMLIAQAVSEPMHFLTRDKALAAYTPLVTIV